MNQNMNVTDSFEKVRAVRLEFIRMMHINPLVLIRNF